MKIRLPRWPRRDDTVAVITDNVGRELCLPRRFRPGQPITLTVPRGVYRDGIHVRVTRAGVLIMDGPPFGPGMWIANGVDAITLDLEWITA